MTGFIDTHAHLDGGEFREDLPQVVLRAKQAGVKKVFIPAINADNVGDVLRVCRQYPGFAFPMVGLQPEEVNDDWADQLKRMKAMLLDSAPRAIASLPLARWGLTSIGRASLSGSSWRPSSNR